MSKNILEISRKFLQMSKNFLEMSRNFGDDTVPAGAVLVFHTELCSRKCPENFREISSGVKTEEIGKGRIFVDLRYSDWFFGNTSLTKFQKKKQENRKKIQEQT